MLYNICFFSFSVALGIKLIVLADPKQSGIENLLKKIYELYSDYALKNPFYSIDMPIRYDYCKWEQVEGTNLI